MKYGTRTSKDIQVSMRIDGSFHLSDGVAFERLISKNPHKPLSEFCDSIFTAGRNKRTYTKKGYGYPYLSNSDAIAQNPFNSCKYNSRKYGYDESAFLKEGMVLTGRVGAIGQTAYVTKEYEKKEAMGSDNIIRIIAKPSEYSGYIYSFLSSKIGNILLWKLAAGGVQPYITDQMVANIPVPIFPETKQQEIHNLIVESANLRVEANRLLEEAQNILTENICYNSSDKKLYSCVSSKSLRNSFTRRFEADYYVDEGEKIANHIKNNLDYKSLKEVTSDIFRPGIFKRVYVNKGITFLGGSDIMQRIPSSEKQLSSTKTKNIKSLMLEKGWILVTCGGTIGNSVFVDSEIAKCAASQHILRLIPQDIPAGYLFAFINSNLGKKIIQRYTYGSVIPQVEPIHIERIPVPLLNLALIESINKLAMDSITKNEISKKKELEAIHLVEQEISLWQQS